MIYSIIPANALFQNETQIRPRSTAIYKNMTVETCEGKIQRIISTNPMDYLTYSDLLGQDFPNL